MSVLAEILSSKVRAEVFRLLFGLDERALHMREIERKSGFAIGTVQAEMKKLSRLDLVWKRRDGNRLYYSANREHPLFPEIHTLVIKTIGLADVLRAALVIEKAIRVAFVFGSLADHSEKAESDIDIMVIGDIGLRVLSHLLQGKAEKLGREINPYALTPKEFRKRKNANEHFLTRVMKAPKLFIIGDDNVLEAMGQ